MINSGRVADKNSQSLPFRKVRQLNSKTILQTTLALYLFWQVFIGRYYMSISHNDSVDQATLLHCQSHTCCFPWSVNTDDWWTHHYNYISGSQNATHTCFDRINNIQQELFLRQIYNRQWNIQLDCSRDTLYKASISSGYAAALSYLSRSYYATIQQNGPVWQVSKLHANANWNFAVHCNKTGHWAYCQAENIECYFLPFSHCSSNGNITGRDDAPRGTKPTFAKQKREYQWLRQYAFRPRHKTRSYLMMYQQQHAVPVISSNCTAIHVRRTDIAFGKGRRYAPVDEYLVAGNVEIGETVVLLTDDQSAVDEVREYLDKDYNWIILDRPRFAGPQGGFESFVPSNDPAQEVLAIMAEVDLASRCNKLVHGKSGFVELIIDAMDLWHGSKTNYSIIYLQNQQDKALQPKMDPQDRASQYLNQIKDYYNVKHSI